MTHVVFLSGGIGSWAAGKRVVDQYGPDDVKLLFTDTKFEDEDTYRFLRDAAENIGGELIIASEGRDIWEVFADNKFLANSRVDICSRVLKREVADKWISDNYKPDEVVCYIGIDWTEMHRYERLAPRKLPYVYKAPLCEPPYLTKAQLHQWAESEGLKKQRLYEIGMAHANCGGGCVKAGQAHWKQLYQQWPARYKLWEDKEQELYTKAPKAKPFLRVTQNGDAKYLTLKQFREEYIETNSGQIDLFDYGGCGCFSEQDGDSIDHRSTEVSEDLS